LATDTVEAVQRLPQLAPHDLAEDVPAPDPEPLVELQESPRVRRGRRKTFRSADHVHHAIARVFEYPAARPLRCRLEIGFLQVHEVELDRLAIRPLVEDNAVGRAAGHGVHVEGEERRTHGLRYGVPIVEDPVERPAAHDDVKVEVGVGVRRPVGERAA
jgi:hypothetical protein